MPTKVVHYNGSSTMHAAVFQTCACHDVASRDHSGGETAVLLSKADCQFREKVEGKYLQGYQTTEYCCSMSEQAPAGGVK